MLLALHTFIGLVQRTASCATENEDVRPLGALTLYWSYLHQLLDEEYT